MPPDPRGNHKHKGKKWSDFSDKPNPLLVHADTEHPRRCIKFMRNRLGSPRCRRFASYGSKYCSSHGGRAHAHGQTTRRNNGTIGTTALKKGGQLSRFYSKELGTELSKAVERFLDTPIPEQQLSLWEELAIMRHTATHAVTLYSNACKVADKARETGDETVIQKAESTLFTATQFMRDACKEVADVAAKAARVENQVQASSGVITPAQVGLVIDQVMRCAQEAFGVKKTQELEHFKILIRNNVRMPRSGASGTELTPDQDVREMQATIPAPDAEDEDDE